MFRKLLTLMMLLAVTGQPVYRSSVPKPNIVVVNQIQAQKLSPHKQIKFFQPNIVLPVVISLVRLPITYPDLVEIVFERFIDPRSGLSPPYSLS